jgi:pimeloyl-ACP methyl ester carboxylesterase
MSESFSADVEGGQLHGSLTGAGPPVLLLHGGPGLSWDYLRPVVAELADGYRVAAYQQRGLAPSTARAPYEVAVQAADAVAVLDALAWERAIVVGHSWGGHLLLHVLADHPERVSGALIIDTLGGVGDGGEAEFDAEMIRRMPPEDVARAEQLELEAIAGRGSERDQMESMRLFWPTYFANPALPAPFPGFRSSVEAYAATFASLRSELPGLAGRIAGVSVPTTFLHGAGSPMPVTASSDTARAMGPAARVEILGRAGHFPWLERPGTIRAALDRL